MTSIKRHSVFTPFVLSACAHGRIAADSSRLIVEKKGLRVVIAGGLDDISEDRWKVLRSCVLCPAWVLFLWRTAANDTQGITLLLGARMDKGRS